MDNNPSMLKSSMFGGFKKKDVLSYIFELNESTQEAQQKFAEQIEELDQSRTILSRNIAELEARLASVQADLDDAAATLDRETAKNAEISEQLARLKEEAAKRENYIAEKEGEILRVTALNAELQDKNRQLEEKRGQVELAASQIARLLSEARSDADNLLEGARCESDKVAAEAEKRADGIIAGAKASAASHVADANKSVNDIYKQFSVFNNELGSLGKTVAAAVAEITAKIEALNEAAEKAGNAVPETLELDEAALLSYESVEDAPAKPAPVPRTEPAETSEFAKEVLGRYGVRKDDSGFFRLAAEKR